MAARNKHLHTGVDLVNRGPGEEVFPAATGKVVSIYAKEPNRGVMIEHQLLTGETVWTVYVHVTKIMINLGEVVSCDSIIAHLMNADQLNKYGWEYNHLHFEVLKKPRIARDGKYLSYSTKCRTTKEVKRHFYDPIEFLGATWTSEK